jgi:urease gamma subunit
VDITVQGTISDQLKQAVKDVPYNLAANNQYIFHVIDMNKTNSILAELMKQGLTIVKVEPVRQSLETLISKMIKEN